VRPTAITWGGGTGSKVFLMGGQLDKGGAKVVGGLGHPRRGEMGELCNPLGGGCLAPGN
jgi:hypothetical protein